jgi:hypothetical protein
LTGRKVPEEQFKQLNMTMRVSGLNAEEFATEYERLSKVLNTSDPKRILDTFSYIAARGSDVTDTIDGLTGAFKDLNKSERNMQTATELMRIFKVKTIEDLDKLLNKSGKKSLNNELINIPLYKKDELGRMGKEFREIDDIAKDIVRLKNSNPKVFQELFGNIDTDELKLAADYMEKLKEQNAELNATPEAVLEKLAELFSILTEETAFRALKGLMESLAKWLNNPDNIASMIKTFENLGNTINKIADFLGIGKEPITKEQQIQQRQSSYGFGPGMGQPSSLASSSNTRAGLSGGPGMINNLSVNVKIDKEGVVKSKELTVDPVTKNSDLVAWRMLRVVTP